MARTFTPKTPGVFPEPKDEDLGDVMLGGDEPKTELVMQPAPDIAAMIAAEVRKGIAAAMATNARALVQAQPEHLPDQRDVDAALITEMTLTKQGYVIPAKYGSFAADVVKH